MAKHGKKYQDAAKLIEEGKAYAPAEAMELVKKTATAKFDETSASIRSMLISRSVAQLYCPMVPARPSEFSSLQRVTRSPRQRLQVLIM